MLSYMKKCLIIALAVLMLAGTSVTAQNTSKGNWLVTASLLDLGNISGSGLDMSFGDGSSFNLGVGGGYFLIDKLALMGEFGMFFTDGSNAVGMDVGARYYFAEVGPGSFYAGGLLGFDKWKDADAQFALQLNCGYAFFLNEHVSLDPIIKLNIPFTDGSDVTFHIGGGITVYF